MPTADAFFTCPPSTLFVIGLALIAFAAGGLLMHALRALRDAPIDERLDAQETDLQHDIDSRRGGL